MAPVCTGRWRSTFISPIARSTCPLRIRVIAGVYPVQNVNAYDSRLKGGLARSHGVATKYLENYLGWRRWLERWGARNSPQIGLYAALGWENRFQLLMQT